jgi:hypothetical protein
MRFRVKHYLAGLAVLTLTMPVWARAYKVGVHTHLSDDQIVSNCD